MFPSQRSGTPHSITDGIVHLVDGLVTQDRRVTVKALAVEVGLSFGSVHAILTEPLNWRKMCAQWVLHCLEQQEECRGPLYLSSAAICQGREWVPGTSAVVARDESWCHHFEPESKRQCLYWKHSGSPPPKNPRPSTQVQESLCRRSCLNKTATLW